MALARRINQFCPEYTVSGCITGQSLEYGGIHMTGERADRLGKKIISAAVRFFVRAAIGMAMIFFINQYVIPPDSSINVGLNAVSFLTSGTLGIPGVGLLYGIMCYQIL